MNLGRLLRTFTRARSLTFAAFPACAVPVRRREPGLRPRAVYLTIETLPPRIWARLQQTFEPLRLPPVEALMNFRFEGIVRQIWTVLAG